MAPRGDCVCGIEISKEHISIAQYSPADRTVQNVSIAPRPFEDTDSAGLDISLLKPKIKKLIAGMKAMGQDAIVAVPSDFAIVKKVLVDSGEQNIRNVIGWELSQQVIGSIEEYTFDFEPCQGDVSIGKSYLAVAYKNEIVQKYSSTLKAGKQTPLIVDLDLFALINVFAVNYPDKTSAPAVIVYGKDDSFTAICTQNSEFVDFESVAQRVQGSSPDAYASCIRETIASNFQSAGQCPVFCTGAAFLQPDFTEGVLSQLGNAQLLNPFTVIPLQLSIPENDMQKCLPYLAVCVGLALRGNTEENA